MSTITLLHLSDIHFKRSKDDENKTYRNDVRLDFSPLAHFSDFSEN
jgi:hypothetical protein